MDSDLDRFLQAQEETYDGVKTQLGSGHKSGHWMWFVFPQADGLGTSPLSRCYAITSLEGAAAYAAHPVLGARLRECAGLLLLHSGHSAADILGPVDAMKLRSSMTLFQAVAPEEPSFGSVLEAWFDGIPDPATLRILTRWRSPESGLGGGAGLEGLGQ